MKQVNEYVNRTRQGENITFWIPITHIYHIRRNTEGGRKFMIFLP
jgi:hypothetical protein